MHADVSIRQGHEQAIREALATLAGHCGIATPTPTIRWDIRGRSVLGQAEGVGLIRLHPVAAGLVSEDEYRQTALHEACHIAVNALKISKGIYSREGRWAPHGGEWKGAMRMLGLRPDRCGTLPAGVVLPPARGSLVTVACACMTHEITSQRAAKISTLVCRKCHKGVRLV